MPTRAPPAITAATAKTFSQGADWEMLGLPNAVSTAWYRASIGSRWRTIANTTMVARSRAAMAKAASGRSVAARRTEDLGADRAFFQPARRSFRREVTSSRRV